MWFSIKFGITFIFYIGTAIKMNVILLKGCVSILKKGSVKWKSVTAPGSIIWEVIYNWDWNQKFLKRKSEKMLKLNKWNVNMKKHLMKSKIITMTLLSTIWLWSGLFIQYLSMVNTSGRSGSKLTGPGWFRVSKPLVQVGYGYYPKFGNRGTLG